MSRATAAGIDASLTRQAFVERYAAAKRRHVPTGDTAGTGPGTGAGAPRSAVRFAPAPALTSRPPVSGHPAFVLPVVSGSGGAGKSTVAVLSALFSQGLGYRTLLLDFDLRFGDAHELVGVPGALAVDEALASPARLEGLAPDGLVPAVLAAPKRLEDAEAVVREAPRLLDDLRGRFDVVVANTGASWAEEHALLLERCSKALFLVDQRPSSLRACRHALELCSRCGIATGPFLFAANRCAKGAPLTSIDVSCALRGAPAAPRGKEGCAMSLLERVERAGNGACLREGTEAAFGLDALKEQVQAIVSADEVAALQAENPGRARSEVRSACRRVFEGLAWAGVAVEQRARLEGELLDAVFGFGPLEGLLADDAVTEIMVNGPQSVFFERDGRLFRSEQRFADEGQLRALVDRVLGPLGRRIDESSPMVNARLPQGHRVHVVIPPLALDGPVLTIRKFARRVMTLADMQALGSFDGAMRQFLTWAVRARKSVAVSGGTGSGKTTLLNALSCAIPHEERIITIEDSAELRFLEHPHVVRLEARPRNAEGLGEVTIRDLVTNALRMRPDRIVVGECRGAEALDMLQAMNTGHDGSLTTLHAVDVSEANIASAIDLVVQTARALDGSRRIAEVVALSYDRERRRCVVEPLFKCGETEACGTWAGAPAWVADLPSRGCAGREEVDAWMRACCSAA